MVTSHSAQHSCPVRLIGRAMDSVGISLEKARDTSTQHSVANLVGTVVSALHLLLMLMFQESLGLFRTIIRGDSCYVSDAQIRAYTRSLCT